MPRRCGPRIAAAAGVQPLDETGFRVGGQAQGLPGSSTPSLTSSRPSARRGSRPEGLRGCLVQDPWQPSCTLWGVRHALCHAHCLRELPVLTDSDGEVWVHRRQPLLRRAQKLVRSARQRGCRWRSGRHDDLLVGEALADPEARPPRRGPHLARRLRDRREAVLRFVSDPCPHNPAEQFPCWLSSPEAGVSVRSGRTRALASGSLREGGLRAPQAVLPEQAFQRPWTDLGLPHPPCRSPAAHQGFYRGAQIAPLLLRLLQCQVLPPAARRPGWRPLIRPCGGSVGRLTRRVRLLCSRGNLRRKPAPATADNQWHLPAVGLRVRCEARAARANTQLCP